MPPYVSIILPVRNEERFITFCLKSISAQDYPKEQMEVIIAEGMSDDGTLGKIAEYDSIDKGLAITVLKNIKQTVSTGLNLGFRNAKGEVFIRMDAHARYGCDYISQCLAVMERTGAASVGGPALALPGDDSAMAQAIALAHRSPFGLGGGAFRNPRAEGFVETVWLGCFKREVFDKVGYIDERRSRTEDIEFNTRLRQAGFKIYLSPLIKAWYYCRTSLWETWRQRWADGCEITRFLPDNPKAPRLRHFIPLVFVSSLAILGATALLAGSPPPCPPRCGEGLLGGLTVSNVSSLAVLVGRTARWLLALELGAYLSAMLFFVGKAGRYATASRRQETGDRRGAMGAQTGDEDLKANHRLPNTEYRLHPILLLPIVFMTLHFSYGLGSLWGLGTLPFRKR